MAEPKLNEGMVAIVTGLKDAGLSVTLTDARQIGAGSLRGLVAHQATTRNISSGVQAGSPERSLSGTQFVRGAPVTAYQRAFGSTGSLSPPLSPTRNAPSAMDIQRLKDQSNELRASLYSNNGQPQADYRFRSPSPPVRSSSPPFLSPSPPYRSPSPPVRSSSPPFLSTSPQYRSPSPPFRSQSPPFRSPSPPVRSPSPPIQTSPHNMQASPMEPPTRQAQQPPGLDASWYMNHQLGSGNSLERGSSATSARRSLRISNAFADSLRKYPSSTERTVSAEIIQRLLAYSQSKNGSKKTLHTKRVRSLTRHSHEISGSYMRKSSNKNIQTYTRTVHESPVRDAAVYGKAERRRRVISPVKSERSDGSPSRQDTTSYDYLKIGSFSHRSMDVRYLNDVTRYVRDTLRQVCNTEEVLCPQMLERLSAHIREHHQVEASTLTAEGKDQISQTFTAKRPKRVCRFTGNENALDCRGQPSRIKMSDSIRMKMVEIKEKLCVICNQPPPCTCDLPPPCPCPQNRTPTLKDRLKSIDFCEEFRRLYSQEPIYEACACPQDVDELIDHSVDEWLKSIPIYAGYTFKEKIARDNIVKDLKTNLKQHIGNENKYKEYIDTCLKDLPMWLPPTEHDQFKEKIANDLMSMMHDVDIFGTRIKRWVEALPFAPDADVNKQKIIDNISRKLKDLAMTTKQLRADVWEAAYEQLENLPIICCTCLEKEELADKLANAIATLPQEVIDNLKYMDEFSSVRKEVEFLEKVRKWVDAIPIETSACIDRETVTTQLTHELVNIILNVEPGALWDSIKAAVQKKLEKLPVQGGRTEIDIQSLKLADSLTKDMFEAVVSKWAKTIAFHHNSNVIPDMFAHDLTKKLIVAVEHVEPEDAEEHMRNIICDELNTMPASGSLSLKVSQAGKLANALSKLGSKETGRIKETVKAWIEDVPLAKDPLVNKQKIVNSLAKMIKHKIDSSMPDDTWVAIKQEVQEELTKLPVTCSSNDIETHAENLADALITSMFNEAVNGWVRSIPFKPDASVNIELFSSDLTKKVKDTVATESPERAPEVLKGQINDTLDDDLLICEAEEKRKLIDGLIDTVIKSPKSRDKVTTIVENWFKKKVPVKTPIEKDKINHLVKKIKNKLTSTSPEEAWSAVKAVILEDLEQLELDCLPSEMEDLAEDLASSLTRDEFEEIVKDWTKNIKFDPHSDAVVEKTAADLIKKLKDALAFTDIIEARDLLKSIIIDTLNEVVLYDNEKKDQEADKLLNALEMLYMDRDKVLKHVEKWMKTVPFKSDTPVNKIKVTRELAKNLKSKLDSAARDDTIWYELKQITKEELLSLPVNGAPSKIETLAENMANLLVSDMLSDTIWKWVKNVPFDPEKPVDKNDLVGRLGKEIGVVTANTNPERLNDTLTDTIDAALAKTPLDCTSIQRNKLAKELADNVAGLPRELDLFSQTIRDWTESVPFEPRPPVDKKKFTSNLTKKLKNIISTEKPEKARDALKEEIVETLKNYHLKCDDAEQNHLANSLADQLVSDIFSDTVRKWVNNIPFKHSPQVDKADLSHKMTGKLRPKFTPSDINKDDIMNTICDQLVKLPIECDPSDKESLVKDLAKDLIKNLIALPPEETEERKRQREPPPTFAINVNDWLKGVTVSLGTEENEELVRTTLAKLRTLRGEGNDEQSIKKELKKDIEAGVDKILAGKKTDPVARQNLAKKLYTQVFDTFKSIGEERKKKLMPKFKKTINDWLIENSEIYIEKNKQDSFVQELTENIANEAIGGGTQAQIRKKIMKTISNTFNTQSKLKNDPDLNNKLTEDLTQKIGDVMGLLSSDVDKKGRKENLYRVEGIQKESDTLVEDRTFKKRIKSLAQRLSGLYVDSQPIDEKEVLEHKISKHTNKFDENTNRKLITKSKSTLVDDLLHSLEKAADFPDEIHETKTDFSEAKDKRKINKWVDNIFRLPSSMHSEQKENENVIDKLTNKICNVDIRNLNNKENVPNDIVLKLNGTTQYESAQINTKTKQILTNHWSEQLLYCSSSKEIEIEHGNPKNIKIKNEMDNFSSISDKTLVYKKANEIMTQNLTNKLANLQLLDDKQIKKDIPSIIEDELENSYEKTKQMKAIDVTTKAKLSDAGTDPVVSNISIVSYSSSTSDEEIEKRLEKVFIKDVTRWIESIPELSGSTFAEKKKIEEVFEALTNKLAKISIQDLNKTQTLKHLQKEITEKLEEVLEYKGEHLDTETELMLANQLLDRLTESVRACTPEIFDRIVVQNNHIESPKATKKEIKKWIQQIPELLNSTSPEKKRIEKMINTLANSLSRIEAQGFYDREAQKKMLNEIEHTLDSVCRSKDQQIDSKTKHKLSKQLLDQLTEPVSIVSNSSSSCRVYEKKHKLKKTIKENVKEWMENISTKSNKGKENQFTQKITENLVESLTNLPYQEIDVNEIQKVMFSKIKNKLDTICDKEGISIDVNAKNKLANELSNKLVKKVQRIQSTSSKKSKHLKKTSLSNEKVLFDSIPDKRNSKTQAEDGKNKKYTQDFTINTASSSAASYTSSSDENFVNKLEKAFKKDVTDWIDEMSELNCKTTTEESECKKLARDLSKKLAVLQTTGQDDLNIQKEMQKEIKKNIRNTFDERGKELDKKTKNKLATKLLQKVGNTIDRVESLTCKEDRSRFSSIPKIHVTKTKLSPTNKQDKLGDEDISDDIPATRTLHYRVKTWFNNIPELQATKSTERTRNKKLLRDLTRNLRNLRSQNLNNSELRTKISSEVKRKLDLVSKSSLDSKTKETLANQLLDQIIDETELLYDSDNSLVDKGTSTQNTQKMFKEVLVELGPNSPSNKKEIDKISEDFFKILNNLQLITLENKLSRNKILTNIKDQLTTSLSKTGKYLSPNSKDSVVQVSDSVIFVTNAEKKTCLLKVFQKDIYRWTEVIPGMACSTRGERKANVKASKALARLLVDVYTSGLNDKEVTKEVIKYIKKHLELVLEKRNERIKPKEVNKLAKKLANTIANTANVVLKKIDSQERIIWDWVHDISLLGQDNTAEKRKKVNELSKSLLKIQKNGVSDDIIKVEMQKEVNRWLKGLSNQSDRKLDKNLEHIYITKLVEDILCSTTDTRLGVDNSKVSSKYSGVYRGPTSHKQSVGQVTEVFYIEESTGEGVQEVSKEIDARTQAKIFGLITHNIDAMDVREDMEILKKQIVKILKEDAELLDAEASNLADSILKSAKDQALKAGADEKQLLLILRQEIKRIMSAYPIDKENRDMVEAFLMDMEVKRLFEGISYDDAKEEILDLLIHKGGLSKEDAVEMLGQLGGNYDHLLGSPAISKSVMRIKSGIPRNNALSLMEDYSFENKAKDILDDFFSTYVDFPSEEKQKQIDKVVKETVSNLEDIKNDLDKDPDENVERMRTELNKQLRRISLDTDDSVTNLAEEVLQKVEEAYMKCSTRNNISFDTSDGLEDVDISKLQDKYRNGLEDVIESWLDDLPIDKSIIKDKQFKDNIIKDLASVILNREMQLQQNPSLKTTDAKERALLKNTCHKWMKKFLENDDLKTAMSKTNELVNAIKGIPVPKLIETTTPTQDEANMIDAALEWLKKTPMYLNASPEERKRMELAAIEMAKGIKRAISAARLTPGADIDKATRDEMMKHLKNVFPDLDEEALGKVADGFLNNLKGQKVFQDLTGRSNAPADDELAEQNMIDAALEWLKKTPMYLNASPEERKRMELAAIEMAKGIKRAISAARLTPGADIDKATRDEMMKHLKNVFPDLDEEALGKVADGFLNNLKGQKVFQDLTGRSNAPADDKLAEQNMIDAALEWLKKTPMYLNASPEERKRMELAAIEMAKGIKRAISIARLTPGADIDEATRDEIMKHLKNVFPDLDEEAMGRVADAFLNHLKGQQIFQDLTGQLKAPAVDEVALAVDNWARKLAIDTRSPQEQERLEDAKRNLVSRLKQARNQFHPRTLQHEQAVRDEIRKFLRANITDPHKRTDEKYIEEMVKKLEKVLLAIPIEPFDTKSSIKPYKSPADTLYEYIGEWVDNLPVQGETEKVNSIKQNLASKLVNKIGELNMNPDIFNDNDLYQDLLRDEIDKLLEEIPGNPELNKYLPALKKDLISKIMDARQRMLEELAGKFYKQHLRDKISTSLPLPGTLTLDEQASLELLKDKLADAFINLNYSGCDQSAAYNFKTKIANELTRFCNDIFRHYPCARIDVDKLRVDLHKALVKVPIPRDDSMKCEVEQVRIRDLIYDWMKELPLRQETATETLHRNKLAAVLAKRIHDIEMEKQHNDFIDSEPKIVEEITRFINKLLIRQEQEWMMPELVQKLLYVLNRSEQERRFSSSKSCQVSKTGEDLCRRYPCTLSPEDQDHLRRIKARQRSTCKVALECTPLENSSSQTDQRGQCWMEQSACPGVKRMLPQSCAAMPHRKEVSCMTPKTSPCHIAPRVLVKEYFWDSSESCTLHPQKSTQGVQTIPQLEPQRSSNQYCYPSPIEPQLCPYNSFRSASNMVQPLNLHGVASTNPINSTQIGTQTSPDVPYSSAQTPPGQRPEQYTAQALETIDAQTHPRCLCPQESETPFKKTRPYFEDVGSSDEECPIAGPSQFYRRFSEEMRNKRICGVRRSRLGKFGNDEEFWNPCWRHRGRRPDRPEGCRIDTAKDNGKCSCKDRVLISCKGNSNRYVDLCQACGTTCPHPRGLFFK